MLPRLVLPEPIQRPPTWLQKALGIVVGINPRNLLPDVQPVIDAWQDGAGVMRWAVSQQVSGVNAVNTQIISQDADNVRLFQVSLTNAGAVAIATVDMFGPPPAGTGIKFSSTSITAREAAWAEIGGGMIWGVVPPGFGLVITIPAVVATATIISLLIGTAPTGSKVW